MKSGALFGWHRALDNNRRMLASVSPHVQIHKVHQPVDALESEKDEPRQQLAKQAEIIFSQLSLPKYIRLSVCAAKYTKTNPN